MHEQREQPFFGTASQPDDEIKLGTGMEGCAGVSFF